MERLTNRADAARRLAERLSAYRGQVPLVLGIPRGGVPMAGHLARALEGELDLAMAHKIPAPGNPELAVGAVSEDGHIYLNPDIRWLNVPRSYLEEETARQIQSLGRRRSLYTGTRHAVDRGGRVVIVVDDGVATGATTIVALREVRSQRPAELVLATAVCSTGIVRRLEQECDAVATLIEVPDLRSVGEYFEDFTEVSDEEVIQLLAESKRPVLSQQGLKATWNRVY